MEKMEKMEKMAVMGKMVEMVMRVPKEKMDCLANVARLGYKECEAPKVQTAWDCI